VSNNWGSKIFIIVLSNPSFIIPNEEFVKYNMYLRIVTIAAAAVSAIAIDSVSPCGNLTISSVYKPISSALQRSEGGPPYSGTIFVEGNIITSDDPTTYKKKKYQGIARRRIYDRRKGWVNVKTYQYEARYKKNVKVEFLVHEEFDTQTAAAAVVDLYSADVGRLPRVLLKDISQVWIMKGYYGWGGGRNSDGTGHILIHTKQGDSYRNSGIVVETLLHEGVHGTLDSYLYNNRWSFAAVDDPNYISTYARDYPLREDIAETFLLYFAVAYTKKRLQDLDLTKIVTNIPHRIALLNDLDLDMFPYKRINLCKNKRMCDDNNFCQIAVCKKKNTCKRFKVKNCQCIKSNKGCFSDTKFCCSLTCKSGKCT